MTDPSADQKRLAEIQLAWKAAKATIFGWPQDMDFLLRLLDASQARVAQAERERDEMRNRLVAICAADDALAARVVAAEERTSALSSLLRNVRGAMVLVEPDGGQLTNAIDMALAQAEGDTTAGD